MAHLLGAKELQSFIVYPLIPYDYAYGTKADLWTANFIQDNLVHYQLMIKLHTYIMRRMQ
jgi:hypothetical protein